MELNIELHHAPENLEGDIPKIEFNDYKELLDYFWGLQHKQSLPKVFVFTYDENGEEEVVITDSYSTLNDCVGQFWSLQFDYEFDMKEATEKNDNEEIERIQQLFDTSIIRKFFLYEFENYKEAYELALDLKEINPLCYPGGRADYLKLLGEDHLLS